MTKRKAGRPRTPKETVKAPGISVRLTPDERRLIESAIKRSGLSQSEFTRKALIYVAQEGIRIT